MEHNRLETPEDRNAPIIQFAGSSGTGKSTLAKWVSEEYNIPFVSGSYSDLIPDTKEVKHEDMLSMNPQEIYYQDTKLLNLRHKSVKEHLETGMVSDRSYLDSAAYMVSKLASKRPKCDISTFLSLCRRVLTLEVTHLIYLPFYKEHIDLWKIEDNNKRILNPYYQWSISLLMDHVLLELWEAKEVSYPEQQYINPDRLPLPPIYKVSRGLFQTKVMILPMMELEVRKYWINKFLTGELCDTW